jgi:hypothetical protein
VRAGTVGARVGDSVGTGVSDGAWVGTAVAVSAVFTAVSDVDEVVDEPSAIAGDVGDIPPATTDGTKDGDARVWSDWPFVFGSDDIPSVESVPSESFGDGFPGDPSLAGVGARVSRPFGTGVSGAEVAPGRVGARVGSEVATSGIRVGLPGFGLGGWVGLVVGASEVGANEGANVGAEVGANVGAEVGT